jgi:hypothetical protein
LASAVPAGKCPGSRRASKRTAFLLVMEGAPPDDHSLMLDVQRLDPLRRLWQQQADGAATGGRGRFDTRLEPPIY